ncbi:MAG: hypothetical protein ACLPYS_09625 [Vulcanimicrobiaceae bacterium]
MPTDYSPRDGRIIPVKMFARTDDLYAATFRKLADGRCAQAVVLAVVFSPTASAFFGYYPALKNSQLNQIDALRFD